MFAIVNWSYKGGAGRSCASANMAAHLAERGNRVLLIDGDLGAPGLHYIFGVERFVDDPSYLGTHHLLRGQLDEETLFDECLIDLGTEHQDHLEWSLPEGRLMLLASSYAKEQLSLDDPDVMKRGTQSLERLASGARARGFDYVIIDSTSGLQNYGGWYMGISDLVLVYFRWTLQHVEGTYECLNDLLDAREDAQQGWDWATVATSVPDIEELAKVKNIVERLQLGKDRKYYASKLGLFGAQGLPLSEIDECVQLKFAERIVTFSHPEVYGALADEVERLATSE